MFKHMEAKDISASFEDATRQYLVGQLKRPQVLAHFDADNIEIGLTSYVEYTIEAPHYHTTACEYCYIISGETKYIDLDMGKEICYGTGDFYKIEQNTKYAQKSAANTLLLFIKVPPGNDKEALPPTSKLLKWFEDWSANYKC